MGNRHGGDHGGSHHGGGHGGHHDGHHGSGGKDMAKDGKTKKKKRLSLKSGRVNAAVVHGNLVKIRSEYTTMLKQQLLLRLQDDCGHWDAKSPAPPREIQDHLESVFEESFSEFSEKIYARVRKSYTKQKARNGKAKDPTPRDRWLQRLSELADGIDQLANEANSSVAEKFIDLRREISEIHGKLQSVIDNNNKVTAGDTSPTSPFPLPMQTPRPPLEPVSPLEVPLPPTPPGVPLPPTPLSPTALPPPAPPVGGSMSDPTPYNTSRDSMSASSRTIVHSISVDAFDESDLVLPASKPHLRWSPSAPSFTQRHGDPDPKRASWRTMRKMSCTSMDLVMSFQQIIDGNEGKSGRNSRRISSPLSSMGRMSFERRKSSAPSRLARSSVGRSMSYAGPQNQPLLRVPSLKSKSGPPGFKSPPTAAPAGFRRMSSGGLGSAEHEEWMVEAFGEDESAIPEERVRGVFNSMSTLFEVPQSEATDDPGEADDHGQPRTLSFENFKNSLTDGAVDMGLNQDELQRIWDTIDQDGQGNIDFQVFSKAVREIFFLREVVTNLGEKAKTRFEVPKDYDYAASTNDNYRTESAPAPDLPKSHRQSSWANLTSNFVGKYVEVRATRDYTYHVHYTKERQHWQDTLIGSVVKRTVPQPNPWIIFTCGPMGVGKGYTLSWLSANGYFPLENIVHVDPDHFKRCMPEWDAYVARDKEQAGVHCHRESCYIAELAQELAMNNSQNVWVDGSLRDAKWYGYLFRQIRRNFPQYRIAIFYISATEKTIRGRIKSRAERTGRAVAESLIVDSLQSMANSLEKLTPLADFVARIANESMPTLLSVEKIDLRGVWDVLKERFASVHSSPGDFPQSLAPFIIIPLEMLHSQYCTKHKIGSGSPADQLHVIKQVLTLRGSKEDLLSLGRSKPINVKVQLGPLLKSKERVSWLGSQGELSRFARAVGGTDVVLSPVHPVNLAEEARNNAGIPAKAASFAWCYPHPNVNLKTMRKYNLDIQAPMLLFLWMGAFVYFDGDGEILGLNVLDTTYQRRRQQIHTHRVLLIQFGPPNQLTDYTMQDLQSLGARWQPVNTPSQYKKGSRRMAWLKPFEKLGAGNQSPFGSFVFLFHTLTDRPSEKDKNRNVYFPVIGG